ncbi:MAG TPA: hypothetical protein V6D05_09040 [Stenomitos sp.]
MGEGALRSNRLFDSQIDLHDRQHFEIAFNYDVSPAATGPDGRAYFKVDAFYFLPTNLGVSAMSYGKDDFFKDVLSYLRFKTPNLSSHTLADPLSSLSPLNILSFNLKQLVDQPEIDARLERSSINEAKLLGAILIANWRDLRKQARELGQALGRRPVGSQSAGELLSDIANRLEAEHEVLLKYRALRRAYADNQACLSQQLLDALRLVDEYLTYRFDENLAKIHESFLGVEHAALIRFDERLRWLGMAEAEYRRDEGFIHLSSDTPDALELYTYRTGALKKYLAQVLYLNIRTVREVHRFRGIVAAFGAALAAFWSTLGDRNVNVRLHGVSTSVLILTIVLVYVLKDRIKEFFKDYLASQVQRLLPDQRLTIIDPMTQRPIGTCRQTVRYEAKRKLPEDIRRIRELNHSIDLDEGREEEVLSYRHSVKLEAKTIHATHVRRMHVKHILRYSVASLLKRLSDPHVKVSRFNERSGRFEVMLAPKVYHVNVIFRVTKVGPDGRPEEPVYHRVRVVLNKDGIERVEPVVQNKRLWELDHLADGLLPHEPASLHVTEAEDLSPS